MLTSGRTTNILLIVVVAIGAGIVAMLASGVRGGPLDPPGPPASTQSNVIFQPASCAAFPIVLSAPGSYRLGSNITGCGFQNAIRITASNVSLDLGGFAVIGGFMSGTGIKNIGANGQLSIANGTITGWWGRGLDLSESTTSRVASIISTQNGVGIQLGAGTALSGITVSSNDKLGVYSLGIYGTFEAVNVAIRDCEVNNNAGDGIHLEGIGAVVEACHVSENAGNGITVGGSCSVANNAAASNGGSGIVILSPGRCSVMNNKVTSNTASGVWVRGDNTWIDGNHASGNGVGFNIYNASSSLYPNIVTRNVTHGNGVPYAIGAVNDSANFGTATGATNPFQNLFD